MTRFSYPVSTTSDTLGLLGPKGLFSASFSGGRLLACKQGLDQTGPDAREKAGEADGAREPGLQRGQLAQPQGPQRAAPAFQAVLRAVLRVEMESFLVG